LDSFFVTDNLSAIDAEIPIKDPLIPEDGRCYEVRVYPNRAAYLRAASAHGLRESYANSHAVTFHEKRYLVDADGRETPTPIVGSIYVHRDLLDGEIVAHEAVHAGLNLFRLRHHGSGNIGSNQTESSELKEEELALSIGRLTQEIADKLHELYGQSWSKA